MMKWNVSYVDSDGKTVKLPPVEADSRLQAHVLSLEAVRAAEVEGSGVAGLFHQPNHPELILEQA